MKIVESYTISEKGISINYGISIVDNMQSILEYRVSLRNFEEATKAVLEYIKDRLSESFDLSAEINTDETKNKFYATADAMIKENLPGINDETKDYMIWSMYDEMNGLGYMEVFLRDEMLEEIIINSPNEPIYVYHRKYGWLKTNIHISSDQKIRNYADIIARKAGRQITELKPILDAHLEKGDRSNAILSPVAQKGHSITIRRFVRDSWTIADMINNKTCSSEVLALIWLSIQYEMNVFFSGGTASGKTTFMNVCMVFFPRNQRIITIEDTRELNLPKHLLWTPLLSKQANSEGKGEITMLNLLINSLRMRPDRIILGEVRKSEDARVSFEAMHTGHSVYATIHANDMNSTISRLINPPIDIPQNLLESVDLNIVMYRNRKTGLRRVLEIGEFLIPKDERENEKNIYANILYKWDPASDEITEHSTSMKLFSTITHHTGLSLKEIYDSVAKRKDMLEYLAKNNIRDINIVSRIINRFYIEPEKIWEKAKANQNHEELLK